jgi:hypothetical protein
MTQPASQPDDSAPLSRRDLLRLGAASLGAPLLALPTTPHAAADPPAQINVGATALPDLPIWDGDDYPGHPDPRARTVNNLKFMALAMHNFAAMNAGRLPTAAIRMGEQPLLSWRVAILPFLEQSALFVKFHLDEAWDSPHNASLLKEMPRVYAPVAHKNTTPYATHYQGFVGPGAVFDGNQGTRIVDVINAKSPTLMIVEAVKPVPWTKPEDLPYAEGSAVPELGGQFKDGSYVAVADGSVRFLSRTIAPETLRALITQRRR